MDHGSWITSNCIVKSSLLCFFYFLEFSHLPYILHVKLSTHIRAYLQKVCSKEVDVDREGYKVR